MLDLDALVPDRVLLVRRDPAVAAAAKPLHQPPPKPPAPAGEGKGAGGAPQLGMRSPAEDEAANVLGHKPKEQVLLF